MGETTNKSTALFADPGDQGGTGGQGGQGGQDGAGAGGGQGGAAGQGAGAGAGQGEEQQGGQAQQQPAALNLSEDAIRKLAEAVSSGRQGDQQGGQQRQPTQEELDKMFNVYKPSPELIKALREGGEPAALAAISQMTGGAVKQALTLAAYQMQQELNKFRQMVEPAMQYAYEQQMEKMKSEFFTQHPDLKGYDPILTAIRDKFIASGVRFENKEAAFKAVAEEARKVLSNLPGYKSGEANGGGGSAAGQQKSGALPSLAGGRGGAGAGDRGSSGGQPNTAKKIFG